jgi:hypothetical protein
MNIEVFVAVLAALIVYRVLSPLIDTINPLANLNRPKAVDAEVNDMRDVLANIKRRKREAAHEMFGRGVGKDQD